MENNKDICPFLGIRSDQNTCAIYPSRGNHCHRVSPPERVDVTYQAQCCIGGEYEQCPVYSQDSKGVLPEGIATRKRTKKILWRIIIVVLALGVISTLVFLWPSLNLLFSEVLASTPSIEAAYFTTPTGTQLPSPMPTKTLVSISASTSTPTSTLTFTPTITATPVVTAGPSFATPFGPDKSYLIHSVRAGESFAALANKYQTTKAVIEALNVLSASGGLWPGTKLVIMPGQIDPANLPKFEVVFLDQQMDVIEIAGMYSASVEDIRYYNGLSFSFENIPAGRWLIIPVGQ